MLLVMWCQPKIILVECSICRVDHFAGWKKGGGVVRFGGYDRGKKPRPSQSRVRYPVIWAILNYFIAVSERENAPRWRMGWLWARRESEVFSSREPDKITLSSLQGRERTTYTLQYSAKGQPLFSSLLKAFFVWKMKINFSFFSVHWTFSREKIICIFSF